MKYINVIVIIFIIFISQIMVNKETAFEAGIIIIATSLVMMVLNAIESRKLYKLQNREKYIMNNCIIFIWLIFVIIAGLLIYNAVLYSELMHNLP